MSFIRFWKDVSGQSSIFGALGMIVIVAFVGLAVDVGSLRYSAHKLQAAADSAALSAALEVTTCGSGNVCSAMKTAASSALTENGLTSTTATSSCTPTSSSGLTLIVNSPPCFQGASDPNANKSGYVEAIVSETEQTYFARLVGVGNVPLIARAEAMKTSNPNCIYALDPSGANAITVDVLASLSANCGVVDESSSPDAFSCNLLSSVHVANLKIHGGRQSFLCNSQPVPHVNAPIPIPADPLAWLPKPNVSSCGSSTASPYYGSASQVIIVGTATLYPNQAYCGGIIILPTAHVTFMPGTYVLRSNGLLGAQGGLSVDLASTVLGNGVTFYNYGPVGGINFVAASITLGQVSLLAPSSGTYGGVLFFQDPGNTTPDVIVGSSSLNTTVEGAYYFPSSSVTCALTGPAKYNILIAKDIAFTAVSLPIGSLNNTSFGTNYSSLLNGSPLAGSGSVLVQ